MTALVEPSRAELARTLAQACRLGVLGTLARKPAGYPYASLTPFALDDDDGSPLLVISRLAEHTRNLVEDPRCSLLLVEAGGGEGEALAQGRLTLLGRAQRLEPGSDPAEAALGRFVARHPEAAAWARFGDFAPWRIELEALRWIGGFARMGWLTPEDWRAARPDPLAPHASGILAHMNDDHADALEAIARAFASAPPGASVVMVGLDRYGFEVEIAGDPGADPASNGARTARLGFDAPLSTPMEVRKALVALVTRARAALS